MYYSEIKNLILKKLEKDLGHKVVLKTSLNKNFGDLSVFLSKKTKVELGFDFIERTEIVDNFLNIFIKKPILFQSIISETSRSKKRNGEKVVIEYLGPNTNKPLHLGHIRNGAIGTSMANIFEELGYEVSRVNMVNDKGIHICKSMLAYQKWGKKQTPESMEMKGDHFVGYWYVVYSQKETPELKKEVQEMLQKWEKGDKKIIELWQKMNNWFYQGIKKTYERFNFNFDKEYFESNTYKLGKEIVEKGLKEKLFYRGKEGDVLFDLPEKQFGVDKDGVKRKVTLLREDGTSVYLTQDIGTAVLRKKDYDFDRLIYVVCLEQKYHFRCLFFVLKALGYSWAEECFHLSYGMVFLPEGKMKSREGKIVDADNLIEELQTLIEKKYGVEKKKALKIALSAVNFNLLSIQSNQEIHFNPEKSIALEGKTGPYCQYSLVRALSILEKKEPVDKLDFSQLKEEKEIVLIRQLGLFPEILERAKRDYDPGLMAKYIYELAKIFNQFYAECPVLKSRNFRERIQLTEAFANVMKKGLSILNIPLLEKM